MSKKLVISIRNEISKNIIFSTPIIVFNFHKKNPTIPGTGNEPFVVGAAFALNEGKTSSLIAGEKGVYMVVLLKKNIVPDLDDYSSYSKLILKNSSQNLAENIFNALKSVANIEDNRALYY